MKLDLRKHTKIGSLYINTPYLYVDNPGTNITTIPFDRIVMKYYMIECQPVFYPTKANIRTYSLINPLSSFIDRLKEGQEKFL